MLEFPIDYFKRHGRWRSENAKDGYVKDDVTSRLQVSRKLGLYLLSATAFFVALDVFINNDQPTSGGGGTNPMLGSGYKVHASGV